MITFLTYLYAKNTNILVQSSVNHRQSFPRSNMISLVFDKRLNIKTVTYRSARCGQQYFSQVSSTTDTRCFKVSRCWKAFWPTVTFSCTKFRISLVLRSIVLKFERPASERDSKFFRRKFFILRHSYFPRFCFAVCNTILGGHSIAPKTTSANASSASP